MSHFKFRMQNIVGLRERERDAAAGSYKEALAAKTKVEGQVDELLREHAQQVPLQSASSVGAINTQRLIESQRYQLHLLQQVSQLREQIALIETECEKRRLKLVNQEQALRSLEKLRDKQRAQWNTLEAQREQTAIDQWAGFKYWKESQSS
ncbi:MAG: flagellar export protein FliJ [Pirellulaceae bacterium]|jgi:flagellar export protein FliJ|nr:flagellar export protein FliJ [Pirellulaceae bacterium]